MPWMHKGVLKATSEGRLCTLSAKVFQDIIVQFDHSHSDFDPKDYAIAYVERLNDMHKSGQTISDLTIGDECTIVTETLKLRPMGKARSSFNRKMNEGMQKML